MCGSRFVLVFMLLSQSICSNAQARPMSIEDVLEYVVPSKALTQNLHPIPSDQLPAFTVEDADQGDWEAGTRSALQNALTLQLQTCLSQSQNTTWSFAGKKITRARWCVKTTSWFLDKLKTVQSLNELAVLARIELEWYQSVGRTPERDMLFTGYFYPVMKVKLKPDLIYKHPIYRMPKDLVQIRVGGKLVWRRNTGLGYVKYFTREQIANGALKGRGLEIAYADNPVDPYLLEVQGSGALLVQDAEGGVQKRMIINYAGQNGYAYKSLGKVMRDAGVPEEYISMQGIKRYFLVDHPEHWVKMSNQNPTKVFFSVGTDGPYGSSGVKVTPKHSIAIDTSEFPMGALALIQTERPTKVEGEQALEWKSFSQFAITQDTGGAIKGPGRVDIYWGEGDYAAVVAGQTAHPGKLFLMLAP